MGAPRTEVLSQPPLVDNGQLLTATTAWSPTTASSTSSPTTFQTVPNPTRKVFDPTTDSWSDGTALGTLTKAAVFAGKVIYESGRIFGGQEGNLMTFDGTNHGSAYSGMRDYAISGSWIYVLGSDQQVKKSQDLVNWTGWRGVDDRPLDRDPQGQDLESAAL